jgi:hypothetical protein
MHPPDPANPGNTHAHNGCHGGDDTAGQRETGAS